MDDERKYIQDSSDNIYKVMSTHYLKLSPWEDGEDRRVMEKDINGYKYISYKNACMIINTQFNEKTEHWSYNGKEYIASAIPQNKDVNEHSYFLSTLPNHKAIIRDSKKIVNNLPEGNSLTISSTDGMSEFKMVKHKGKIYYILIYHTNMERAKAYNLFGEFVQWVGIKDCKPIFCKTDNKYI